jgi:cellulose synthase/poly-beta-1,6-N-acetylglucosamine synthase-like glycosyltransferase
VKVAFQKMVGYSKNYYANHLQENEIGKIDILVGAFMFLKRNLYNEVGGFDEDYFMYGEDIDLSYKIKNHGFNNYYFGDTTIIHFKGESTLKDKTYAKRFYGAMRIFYKKHFKSNDFFDTVVWVGIQFAQLFNSGSSFENKKANNYFIYSHGLDASFNSVFPFKVIHVNNLEGVKPNSEVIFDANTLSYTEIIEQILILQKNNTHTFKILPKNSNFILGSNNSKQRGEILYF